MLVELVVLVVAIGWNRKRLAARAAGAASGGAEFTSEYAPIASDINQWSAVTDFGDAASDAAEGAWQQADTKLGTTATGQAVRTEYEENKAELERLMKEAAQTGDEGFAAFVHSVGNTFGPG